MSVIMMTHLENIMLKPGVLKENCWIEHGNPNRVYHGFDCPHYNKRVAGHEIDEQCLGNRCSYGAPLFMHRIFIDRVLEVFERNGYDDSDFYAVVFDEDNCGFHQFEYATTRMWSYSNCARADAPQCVIDLYNAYLDGKAKRTFIIREKERENKERENAEAVDITIEQFKELMEVTPRDKRSAVLELLKVKNFRSKFRESLANQIRNWLKEKKHDSPLSTRQWQALREFRR